MSSNSLLPIERTNLKGPKTNLIKENVREIIFLEAVNNRNLEAVRFFINKSIVQLESRYEDGNTVLHLAVEKNCNEVLKVLFGNGATNLHFEKNEKGEIPLTLAAATEAFCVFYYIHHFPIKSGEHG